MIQGSSSRRKEAVTAGKLSVVPSCLPQWLPCSHAASGRGHGTSLHRYYFSCWSSFSTARSLQVGITSALSLFIVGCRSSTLRIFLWVWPTFTARSSYGLAALYSSSCTFPVAIAHCPVLRSWLLLIFCFFHGPVGHS